MSRAATWLRSSFSVGVLVCINRRYLANTKINAIAQITNEFLETIGSDIRVALSGYTILKSGKVRDKISVSLLRV